MTDLQKPKRLTKQELIDQTSLLLGDKKFQVSSGATEPSEFFTYVADSLGIDYLERDSKAKIAQTIAGFGGFNWDKTCDSSETASGGGGTVTAEGIRRVYESVKILSTKGHPTVANIDEFQVDVSPDAAMLGVFAKLSYTAHYALGEFIDNSVTSALQNLADLREVNGPDYELEVKISFDQQTKEILIEDNAAGIRQEDVASAVRAGSLPRDSESGLSIHGIGMKAAAFWWGRKLEITTFPIRQNFGWQIVIDLDMVEDVRSGEIVVKKVAGRPFPGTTLRISDLNRGMPTKPSRDKIRSYLPSIYRSFLKEENPLPTASSDEHEFEFSLVFDGEPLFYNRPELLNVPVWTDRTGPEAKAPSVLWRKDIDFSIASGKRIKGWVGLQVSMTRDLAGFFLHFRGKGIGGVLPVIQDGETVEDSVLQNAYKPKSIFGQAGSSKERIIGELDVSDFGKTITTDDVTWTPEEQGEVNEKIITRMKEEPLNFFHQIKCYVPNGRIAREARISRETNEDETSILAKASRSIDHGPASVTSLVSGSAQVVGTPQHRNNPDEVLAVEDSEFHLVDAADHSHHFVLRYVRDRSKPFLEVTEDHEQNRHIVVVNAIHPGLDGLPALEDRYEKLVTRLMLALGVAETFLDSPDKAEVRRKFDEMLSKIGSVLALEEGDGNQVA